MKIGGWQKQGLIDFPGKMSTIVFTAGCNFRCRYCHNPGLVLPSLIKQQELINEQEILAYIHKYLHLLDAVVITGGEPTIQPGLREFIKKIKALSLLVKLDTNGSNPGIIQELVDENMVDYIAMDIKAPLDSQSYATITGVAMDNADMAKIKQSIKIIKEAEIQSEFRCTVARELVSKEDLLTIARQIGPADHFSIQNFRDNQVLDPGCRYFTSYNEDELASILSVMEEYFDKVEVR